MTTPRPPPDPFSPPDAIRLRLLQAARAGGGPARSDRTLRLVGLVAFAALAMLTALAAAGGPAHAEGRPAVVGSWVLAGSLALALAATWFTLPPRRSMLAPPRGQLLAVAFAVPVLVGAWLMFWHSAYEDPFVRVGWKCMELTAATAPWPFLALVYASRRLEPRHPGHVGAALGSTAGAWAALMVNSWCPLSDPAHVLVGHVAPVVILSALGAVFGAWRFRLKRVR